MTQEYSQFNPDSGREQGFSHHDPHHNTPGDWSVVLPGTPDALPQVRLMITAAAQRCGFQDEEIAKIEMAVDEACTNIIEHAYQMLSEHGPATPLEIEVRAHEHPDRLEITIIDHSMHDFPVDERAPEGIDDYFSGHKKRGLGLFIIRSFVDDVRHRFVDGHGNELLLVKYFA